MSQEKPSRKDIDWAVDHCEQEAAFAYEMGGSHSNDLKNARRLDVVVKRLAREAGYLDKAPIFISRGLLVLLLVVASSSGAIWIILSVIDAIGGAGWIIKLVMGAFE